MQNTIPGNPKVFFIEDDKDYAANFLLHLRQNQYNDVTRFKDMETAMHYMSLSPDIIFLNFHMKGLNGIEALKQLRKNCPNAHIVLLSPRDKIQIAINAFVYGVTDYVTKGKGDLQRAIFIIRRAENKKVSFSTMQMLQKKQKVMAAVIACLVVSLGVLTWL